MGSSQGPKLWGRILGAVLVSALVATSAYAAQPPDPGFSDGHWEGTIAWDVFVRFDDAIGYADSSGRFSVQFSGGVPVGTFEYAAPAAVGATDESRAELEIRSVGSFEGSASEPYLLPESLSVSGEVLVYGIDRFPVDFTMGAGELDSLPLDITRPGCITMSGLFTTRIADVGQTIASAGGSLSAKAFWTAERIGEGGATGPDRKATLDQLVKDGVAFAAAINDGTFNAAALRQLVFRPRSSHGGSNAMQPAISVALAISRQRSPG